MTMIRHQVLDNPASILRLYRVESDAAMPPIDATSTLELEGETTVWLWAFKGELTRGMLRELVDWFLEHGIVTVKAHRDSAHRLPFVVLQPDGSRHIDVAKLIDRVARGTKSAWGDLGD